MSLGASKCVVAFFQIAFNRNMSIPLFPSLRPNIASTFWCDLDPPIDEEAEILELEREQREWKEDIGHMFSNALPIGKTTLDVDDDDLDEMGDEEDDTTSSDDDDDMDDDDGESPAPYHVHDNSMTPTHEASATSGSHAAARVTTFTSSLPSASAAVTHINSPSNSSSSSDSSVTVILNRGNAQANVPHEHGPQEPAIRPVARPARMIVGRHIPVQRPGMPPQPIRVAFIDPIRRPVYSGRANTGSVSPTSRAYIDAALQSPPGQIRLNTPDDDETDDDNADRVRTLEQASRASRSAYVHRLFPGPVSDHLSQYHQMIAAGQIRPSASSTQIDNLFESIHQAQRAHAARLAASEDEPTSGGSASNVDGSSSTQSNSSSSTPANEES